MLRFNTFNGSIFKWGKLLGTYLEFSYGQQAYTTPGTYSWTCPAGVKVVSVVCVGGGGGGSGYFDPRSLYGGGGGGLGWKNNITVVPGQSYTVVVGAAGTVGSPSASDVNSGRGGDSYFISTSVVKGGGGSGTGAGGTYVGDGGGNGGRGSATTSDGNGAGGAGGYSGTGGTGAVANNTVYPTAGTGGGGGGGGDGNTGTSQSGGSGIVILKFDSSLITVSATTGNPTITTDGSYKVYKYTTSGSITF